MAFKPYCRICRSYHWPRHVCEERAALPDDLRPVLAMTDRAVLDHLRFVAIERQFSHQELAHNLRRMLTGAIDAVREAGSNVRR